MEVMEPETDRPAADDKREEPEDDKASEQSPVPGGTLPPRRALRERGVGRQRTGAAPDPTDTNGAGSGRVLRDRSTRTIPAWLQSDQSDEDGEAEAIADPGANRRRKVACPRRKKNAPSTASTENTGEEVGDDSSCQDPDHPKKITEAQALPSRRTTARAKGPPARPSKGAAKSACKSEPDMDSSTVDIEAMVIGTSTARSDKKEEEVEEDNAVLDDDPLFQDDPKDLNYRPQTQSDMQDELSSDEDVPFTDDLNDQSYNPRDAPKSRRKAPPRQREKKEKLQAAERDEEPQIKVEGGGGGGGESVQEVKLESDLGDVSQEPRKRGRRRKDDKTPRLPKRRKKPPVQYVRCEMEGCGTVLAHPRYLQHHIKYQHLLMKKYVCPHPSCGRLFRLQKQLLRHAKHHTDQRDYICEFCARAFKSSHNLAVHRMIHTGEKPLQCEICGFTCRQKASLNWHMKKHDADATYQFSCSICGKKFEKKDSVVAHKAKSHPEVLIAEALAANAGALITTTPASLLGLQGNSVQGEEVARQEAEPVRQVAQVSQVAQGGPVGQQVTQAGSVALQVGQVSQQAGQVSQQVGQVCQQLGQLSHQVVVLGQDPGLHGMQVPVTIALSSMDPPSPSDPLQSHLQMPLQFVQASPALQSRQQPQVQQLTLQPGPMGTQHQLQHLPLQTYQPQQQQTQILHMTFQQVSQSQTHIQQIPILATSQQLQTLQTIPHTSGTLGPRLLAQTQTQDLVSNDGESYVLDGSALISSASPSLGALQSEETIDEVGGVWEQGGEAVVLADGTEGHMQHTLI